MSRIAKLFSRLGKTFDFATVIELTAAHIDDRQLELDRRDQAVADSAVRLAAAKDLAEQSQRASCVASQRRLLEKTKPLMLVINGQLPGGNNDQEASP